MIERILKEKIDKRIEVDTPPRGINYDLSLNIFKISREENENPIKIAESIKNKLEEKKIDFIKEINQTGPYININIDWTVVLPFLITYIEKEFPKFKKDKKKIIIEHTSANPNKALHIGHLRNFVLGDTLYRFLKNFYERVEVLYYVDDTGVQVADSLLGFLFLGFPLNPGEFDKEKVLKSILQFIKNLSKNCKELEEKVREIFDEKIKANKELYGYEVPQKFDMYATFVYVIVNKLYKLVPNLESKKREIIKKLEEKDEKIVSFAEEFVKKILLSQLQTIWRFNVRYDLFNKESDVIHFGFWDEAFKVLKSKEIIKYIETGEKKGTWCLDLSKWKGFEEVKDKLKILVRSDGTTVYLAKDIGYALWKHGLIDKDFRYEKFTKNPDGTISWITSIRGAENPCAFGNSDISINVIGNEQRYLQKIIERIISELSNNNKKYIHYGYGLVMLSKDTAKKLGYNKINKDVVKMSTRRGLEIFIDPLIEKVKHELQKEFIKRGEELDDRKAEDIAISILRYEMLKISRERTVIFDIERSFSLEENSAIYLLYTYARALSVLKKYKETVRNSFPKIYKGEQLNTYEVALLRKIDEVDRIIEKVKNNLKLNLLTEYIFDLSKKFNEFYQNVPIISKAEEYPHRIYLVKMYLKVAEFLFDILGIKKVEKL